MGIDTEALEGASAPRRPLRIGLIAPPWLPVPPVGYGGIETVVDVLARGLVDHGHEVVLFASVDSTCPVELRSAIGPAPGVDVGGSAVEIHHAVSAYESFRDVDVIHDHTAIGPLVALAGRRGNVATTNHNPFSPPYGTGFAAVSASVAVVAISHHQASTACGVSIAEVIHHGLDPRSFPVGGGRGGYLVFLGRMSPSKGPDRAIAVARATGVPLVLAGKQHTVDEREFFESEIRPQLGGDVTFVGELGPTDKMELLGDAVALINPISWDEPFGMVMVEALACGTPVLGFGRGAAPEIVEQGVTGFLANDEAGLIEAAKRLDELDRVACRAAIEGHFSQDRMVADYVALFEHVVAREAERQLR
ncbi:MAG TPA: glycosyltransferase family 4 protein [Acidimicrobiales bacterium]